MNTQGRAGTQAATTPQAIIYTRVSTAGQAEHGTSLESQKAACLQEAKDLGAVVVSHYEDPGVSGAAYHGRPGIQAALADLEAGRANTLIIANLSRFSRDREHQSVIKRRVKAAGARLVFCDIHFEDTPEGDLAFNIFGDFADYERQLIRSRTMKGRRKMAEGGLAPTRSRSPLGYHIVTKADVLARDYPEEQLGTYQIVPEQTPLVQEIFQRYSSGQSLRMVCRWLQESGVPTTQGGRRWDASSLRRILSNPVYKGRPEWGRQRSKPDESRLARGCKMAYTLETTAKEDRVLLSAPPLVSEQVWDACNLRMEDNRGTGGRRDRKRMLTGLIYCPQCGRRMESRVRRQGETEHLHYACHEFAPSRNSAGTVCHSKQYNGRVIEALVIDAITEYVKNPALLEEAIAAYMNRHSAAADAQELERLRGELIRLEARERAIVKAQIDGVQAGTDTAPYLEALHAIAPKKANVQARIKTLDRQAEQTEAPGSVAELTRELAEKTCRVLQSEKLTPLEKNDLLSAIVERIVPEGDGVRVELRPFGAVTVYQTVFSSFHQAP